MLGDTDYVTKRLNISCKKLHQIHEQTFLVSSMILRRYFIVQLSFFSSETLLITFRVSLYLQSHEMSNEGI